ncbi:MAG: HDOD domain-containing protein [Actinomycetota bacterium]
MLVDESGTRLDDLRRAFHRDRKRWTLTFCQTAAEALEHVRRHPTDVIVSAMPEESSMDDSLYETARVVRPSAARILLTGAQDPRRIMLVQRAAHQVLTGASGPDEIRAAIERLASSRRDIPDEQLRSIVNDVRVLPTPSDVQRRLSDVLSRRHDLVDVAEVIETDVALTAELLRLVNSSFFGLAHSVATVREAVGLLGLELVEATVAARSAFSEHLAIPIDVGAINRHSQNVAGVAGLVAASGGVSKLDRSLAVSAGLLHDIGVLVLAQLTPRGAGDAAEVLAVEDLDAERLAFGVDRFTVGAHLLDVWGFSSRTPTTIRELQAPIRSVGAGTVGWSLRVAHHAVVAHGVLPPTDDDHREWFDQIVAIERELLVAV